VRPIAILGAGLAGLSLADALLDAGLERPLVIIDRRERWDRDRTWCTWDTAGDGSPLRFAGLASHRWWAWRIRSAGSDATARTARHPYLHIDARDLYGTVLERLERDPRVELRTGERISGLRIDSAYPEVVTAHESFAAEYAVDALGPWSPLAGSARSPDAERALSQRFLGWEVELERPGLDPHTATLMDFRAPEADALTFFYELPFSETRALVEHTTIGTGGPTLGRRRELLTAELDARFGPGGWRILHEERGVIPMDETRAPDPGHPRVARAGAAAGAIRPSSGYAFTRTVRHAERLATALADDRPLPRAPGGARLAALDRVFLAALRTRSDHGEALFTRIAAGVGADAFARFMTDVSSPAEELKLLRALPALPMLRAALAARRGA
jgi:lycopene beta-cyclase